MRVSKKVKGLCILFTTWMLMACSSDPSWFKPTGSAVGVPANTDLPFEDYVNNSRKNIKSVLLKHRYAHAQSPYVNNYTVADVVNMRAPFQLPEHSSTLCERKKDGAGKGFLLVHGLTDSPYLLKGLANSIFEENPCALIRAVLLPGHGTVVGDTLDMKYQDWQAITAYGVKSFTKMQSIDSLYIVGFSTGTALAVKQVQGIGNENKIKGLVLLSAAFKASSNMAWLTSYIQGIKPWLDKKNERDAARYSSFSTNAGSQFYQLTKDIMDEKYSTNLPVLMAVSADDATINSQSARAFFCQRVTSKRKLLLWYKGFSKPSEEQCPGISEIAQGGIDQEYEGHRYRYANVAHTGISVSLKDQHYGVNGVYRDCKHYEKEGDDRAWQQCVDMQEDAIFAEKNIADMQNILQDKMWRRGTFNKDYDHLVDKIMCFSEPNCVLN